MADTWIADPSGDDFYRAARLALDADDIRLALEQIAAALSFDPLSERYLNLLELVLSRTNRPLDRLEAKGELFFGTLAVRAHVLARQRRLGDAFAALAEVVAYRPGISYLPWAVRWVQGGRTTRGIRADQALAELSKVLEADGAHPKNLSAASWLLERMASERPRLAVAFTALRTRVDQRLAELVEPSVELHPVGQLLATEQLDAAAELLRQGDSPHAGQRVAIAGFAAYLRARQEPAAPSSLLELERALATVDPSPIDALLLRRARAYRTELPPLAGRLAAVLRDALYRAAETGERRVRIRIVGEPAIPRSALLAFRAGLRDLAVDGEIEHDGTRIELPILPEVDAPHSDLVVAVMAGEFDLDAIVGGRCLPISAAARLLSNPPSPPCGVNPIERLHLAQVVTLGLCSGDSDPQAVWEQLSDLASAEDAWLGAAAIAVLAAHLRAMGSRAPDSWKHALASGFGTTSADDPRERVLASARMATGVLATDDERRAAAASFERGLAPSAGT